jgi:signal transduction histidine kinase
MNDEDLAKFIEVYCIDDRRVWLEDAQGRVLMGRPWEGMLISERGKERQEKLYNLDQGTILVLKQPEPAITAMFSIQRNNEPMVLCFNWRRGPLVGTLGIFAQGVLGLLCISVFLSLWTARKVSRPLSRLRAQVAEIAQGNLALRLTEEGEEEVAYVSKAVNELTDSLSLHIDSMKQLMANMSHEMRSTVTNIALSLEIAEESLGRLLADRPDSPERQRVERNISQARQELDILENMVASGLLGGKLDLRHEALECEPLDFSSLCRQVLSRHSHRALHGRLLLQGRIEDGIWLLGDEILLDRLLANILDNAVKYTSPGGTVELTLAASSEDHQLILTCHNPHPPLTETELKSLCLPYYRVEQSHIQGSGLGLYLAHRITVLHGGTFAAENDASGLLFTIGLPLPDEVQMETAV